MSTNDLYDMLYYLYAYYNEKLFNNQLPKSEEIIIILVHEKRTYGVFRPNRYENKKNPQEPRLHEIALNPDYFYREDVECNATLVHLMIDLCIYITFDKLSKDGYCSVLCADMREELGLIPNGPGGKRTGRKIPYDISPNGKFMQAYNELINKDIKYVSPFISKDRSSEKNKTRYTCKCKRKLWGASGFDIICGSCWEYYFQGNDDLSKKHTICIINSAVEFEKVLKRGLRFPVILIENKEVELS